MKTDVARILITAIYASVGGVLWAHRDGRGFGNLVNLDVSA
jgi:hypothetical protein